MTTKAWRLLAYAGIAECALGFAALACSMGTGHFGMMQAIDALVNLAVLIAAVKVLNVYQPE